MKKLIGLIVLGIVFFIGGQWLGLSISQGNRVSNGALGVSEEDAQTSSLEISGVSAQNGSASPAAGSALKVESKPGTSAVPNINKIKQAGQPLGHSNPPAVHPPLKTGPAKMVPVMRPQPIPAAEPDSK